MAATMEAPMARVVTMVARMVANMAAILVANMVIVTTYAKYSELPDGDSPSDY